MPNVFFTALSTSVASFTEICFLILWCLFCNTTLDYTGLFHLPRKPYPGLSYQNDTSHLSELGAIYHSLDY